MERICQLVFLYLPVRVSANVGFLLHSTIIVKHKVFSVLLLYKPLYEIILLPVNSLIIWYFMKKLYYWNNMIFYGKLYCWNNKIYNSLIFLESYIVEIIVLIFYRKLYCWNNSFDIL